MPPMHRWFAPALAAGLVWLPCSAHGQRPVQLAVEAGATSMRVRSDIGTLLERLDGVGFAVAAALSVRGLQLEGRYAEGKLTSDATAVERRDAAEGEVLLGVRPLPWMTLKAGPHARAYRSAPGTRRWVFWEARVRGLAPIIPARLGAYAEFWGAVAGSTSLSSSFTGERGGEVGATLEIPKTPLAARIAYRIDHGSGNNPTRSDTAEQILFAVRATLR